MTGTIEYAQSKYLKILTEEQYTDCKIAIDYAGERTIFQAHRAIISNESRYLREKCIKSMERGNHDLIEISDVHPSMLWEMLKWMYTGGLYQIDFKSMHSPSHNWIDIMLPLVNFYASASLIGLESCQLQCLNYMKHIMDNTCTQYIELETEVTKENTQISLHNDNNHNNQPHPRTNPFTNTQLQNNDHKNTKTITNNNEDSDKDDETHTPQDLSKLTTIILQIFKHTSRGLLEDARRGRFDVMYQVIHNIAADGRLYALLNYKPFLEISYKRSDIFMDFIKIAAKQQQQQQKTSNR